jgi:fido (protein-threonine AMPylation protein)
VALEATRVWIGAREGVGPVGVARALAAFERTLHRAVAALDARYPREQELDADGLAAVIDLSAWVHAEWVRMHPFANGNGRTARMWANAILMRYGLPNHFSGTAPSARSSIRLPPRDVA